MIGLSALEGLTSVDDKRTRQDHLCKAEQGAQKQALQQEQCKDVLLTVISLNIEQQTDTGYHTGNGPDADQITPVVLNQKRREHPEKEKTDAKGAERDTRLIKAQPLTLHHPYRQDRYQDIDRHRQQEIGNGHAPEIVVPEPDVYGRVLSIHFYSLLEVIA